MTPRSFLLPLAALLTLCLSACAGQTTQPSAGIASATPEYTQPKPALPVRADSTPRAACLESGRRWLDGHNECEGMDERLCRDLGGRYESCGSPCRHDAQARVCIQMCVSYCRF